MHFNTFFIDSNCDDQYFNPLGLALAWLSMLIVALMIFNWNNIWYYIRFELIEGFIDDCRLTIEFVIEYIVLEEILPSLADKVIGE